MDTGNGWVELTFSTSACFKIKCPNIVELKTLLFTYKAYCLGLPSNIQCLFARRETAECLFHNAIYVSMCIRNANVEFTK